MPRTTRRHQRLRTFLASAGVADASTVWTEGGREALEAFVHDFVARAGAAARELPGRQVGLGHVAAGVYGALPSGRHADAEVVLIGAVTGGTE